MLIDTHAHLNFNAYKADFEEVIKRTLGNDVWMINVGTQYDTSKKAVQIAEKYKKGVYAAIGLHPIHLPESQRRVLDEGQPPHRRETGLVKIKLDPEEIGEEESKSIRSFPPSLLRSKSSVFDYQKYKELAKSEKVVAIGEIGLDYYYKPKTKRKLELFKEKQRTGLCQQLDLAKELNLPVIFHCRMAHDDLINFLLSQQFLRSWKTLTGVIHCFSGDWKQAQKYLEMGFYLGFNGLIFKMDFGEIIRKTPLDKILIETDCPYLTPPQVEGRNEPIYVKYVAERIVEIKKISYEEISRITTENAKKLFKI